MYYKLVNIKRIKAMSLVELLITLLIFTLLSGVVIWLFLVGKKTWLLSESRVSLRQEMQVVALRVTKELQDSNLKLVTSVNNGFIKAFSFPSAFDDTGNFVTDDRGYLIWQKYIIYYVPNNSNTLLRREVTDKEFDKGLTSDEILLYCDGTGKRIASSVEDLIFTMNREEDFISFFIKFKKTNLLGEIEEMSFDTQVFILN